ncbi:hypothetical protein ACROYT_G014113 [Oculina patagonica]
MAAVSTTAKIPSPLNLTNRLHQGENWKSFRREWKFYELAAGIHKKTDEVWVASLLNVIGKEGMDMYDTFQWANLSDARKIDKVLEKFEERCVPARNETYERYVFFKREQLSKSLALDHLILGVKDGKVHEKLLGKQDLDLNKVIETIKASQVTHERATKISEESPGHEDINRDYIRATNDHSKAKIVPKDITLVMHDLSRRMALGFARMKVEHNGSKHELNFVIVNQKVTLLLGLQSSKGMGLIKIMVFSADTPINNVTEAPKQHSQKFL